MGLIKEKKKKRKKSNIRNSWKLQNVETELGTVQMMNDTAMGQIQSQKSGEAVQAEKTVPPTINGTRPLGVHYTVKKINDFPKKTNLIIPVQGEFDQ
jgi:hypothetical protein